MLFAMMFDNEINKLREQHLTAALDHIHCQRFFIHSDAFVKESNQKVLEHLQTASIRFRCFKLFLQEFKTGIQLFKLFFIQLVQRIFARFQNQSRVVIKADNQFFDHVLGASDAYRIKIIGSLLGFQHLFRENNEQRPSVKFIGFEVQFNFNGTAPHEEQHRSLNLNVIFEPELLKIGKHGNLIGQNIYLLQIIQHRKIRGADVSVLMQWIVSHYSNILVKSRLFVK